MQVIAEVGSCWLPGQYPLEDAVKAALDCGADLVKIQFWSDGRRLAMRRGGVAGLEKWQLKPKEVVGLAQKLAKKHGKPVLGVSVFCPDDVSALVSTCFNREGTGLAFLKTATQEYQCAALAEAVSCFSASQNVPLYVSVPLDGCLTVGNYWSPLPITWMQCVPRYPAFLHDYSDHRTFLMRDTLPGNVGVSDHTPNSYMLERIALFREKSLIREGAVPDVAEKHFCYNENLRERVPDGGPWSLSPDDFKKYAKVAHGV